jgi:hypothetical protein
MPWSLKSQLRRLPARLGWFRTSTLRFFGITIRIVFSSLPDDSVFYSDPNLSVLPCEFYTNPPLQRAD